MKYSTEDKIFWMDRWKVGLFGQDRIKVFKGQLNDCKGTLSVALSTATVYVFPREITISFQLLLIADSHWQYHDEPTGKFNARDEGCDTAAE